MATTIKQVSPEKIAILGGGITGLASAYFATRLYPSARVTLFESTNRFGGWIRSSKHDINGKTVVFEHGPRSLRPATGTLGLIFDLHLQDQLLLTPKSSPAAKNRYIYYQDRLVNVQQGLGGMVREPVLRQLLLETFQTFFRNGPSSTPDETVGQFLRRRGMENTANNLVSAMLHGIYAGDVDQLSVKSVFSRVAAYEAIYGSPWGWIQQYLLRRLAGSSMPSLMRFPEHLMQAYYQTDERITTKAGDFMAAMSSSVYSLKGGLETLVTSLVKHLESHPNVDLIKGATIEYIKSGALKGQGSTTGSSQIRLGVRQKKQAASGSAPAILKEMDFTGVISTIPSPRTAKLYNPVNKILDQTTAANVCVVNLFYDQPDLVPAKGFGYLIPKSTPRQSNPEGALGVVFDSDATPDLDTAVGTKLTVMLGGPYWQNIPKELLPSNSDAIEMAKGVVAAHLGIKLAPALAQANLQLNCIPQYTVGHEYRMEQAHELMSNNGHWSRAKVAGSWYTGVSVNDCIASAFAAVAALPRDDMFGNETEYRWMQKSQSQELANQVYEKWHRFDGSFYHNQQ